MSIKTKIDRAGRLVIPKDLRDRFGLAEGTEVELVTIPDGVAVIPVRKERRYVRRGRVVAIDTGAETASWDVFGVDTVRASHLDRKGGLAK